MLILTLLGVTGGVEAQTADEQAWIEEACPRGLGPDIWSDCVNRQLRALRQGLPELTGLASNDRAWIEEACPRGLGPDIWSDCVNRQLRALRQGLPELTGLASNDRAWIEEACPRGLGPDIWSDCVNRQLRALRQGLPEEIAEPDPGDATAAHPQAAVPRLRAPADGERWFCYTDELSALLDVPPNIVLTREGRTDQPFGKGQVLVAGVIYDASFEIEGIDRRWDWNEFDMIAINPGGNGGYYNFRGLEPGESAGPSQALWCLQN